MVAPRPCAERRDTARCGVVAVAMALVVAALAPGVCAQPLPPGAAQLVQRTVQVGRDSGWVTPPVGGAGPVVVYATDVRAQGSAWTRVVFAGADLAGPVGTERAARVRLTSLRDGAIQTLDAEGLVQWGLYSAYFNGDGVRVEVLAHPGAGPSRVVIAEVIASEPDVLLPQDLCLGDDRVPSIDQRSGRVIGFGGTIGTGFMFDDTNRFFLTAGHVQPSTGSVVTFNNPPSNADGSIVFPPPAHQYAIDAASVQRQTSGTGNDWCYFGVFPNTETGLQPPQAYGGAFYTLAASIPAASGQAVRVTGFGSTDGFNLPLQQNFTLKTDTGPLTAVGSTVRYQVDTTGGNSGSAVELISSGAVLGIHYLAGCRTFDGGLDLGNHATPITNANLQVALAAPIGMCRTGRGSATGGVGAVYAIGDQANNFGVVAAHPVRFTKVAQVGSRWQGLAWNPRAARFWACDGALGLYEVTPTGAATLRAVISGTGGAIVSGLGYDPAGRVLYGVSASTGQIYAINTTTGQATPIGPASGGNVSGLEWDTARGVLWGTDNSTTPARLVRISPADGSRTIWASLPSGVNACHGLAYDPALDAVMTIHATSSIIYRYALSQGMNGTFVNAGVSFGVFGSAFGLSVMTPATPCPADFNGDGSVDPDDLSDYIACYFAVPPCVGADFNGDGTADPDDLSDYIGAYFAAGGGSGC